MLQPKKLILEPCDSWLIMTILGMPDPMGSAVKQLFRQAKSADANLFAILAAPILACQLDQHRLRQGGA
jgi:hypothetical protein